MSIPAWWDPEQPYVDDYPDERTYEQLVDDQHNVRRQVDNLGPRGQDASVRRELANALVRRRNEREGYPARLVPIPSGRGFEMLVTEGELLIRTEALDDPRVDTFLKTIPFPPENRETIAGLDNRVTRLWSADPEITPQRLNDVARFLRRRGVQVSLNHVAPSGPVGKAQAGPEPTAATLPFIAAPRGVEVAVVDTGIAPAIRTDGWLQAADAPRTGQNEDPLYDPPPPPQLLAFSGGHGTSVCGVIQHLEPGALIRVYRALDVDGLNPEVEVATAMVQAVMDGARLLNASFGTKTLDNQPPIAMQVALELIDEIAGDETVIVAAAGNYGDSDPCWPAAFRRVLSVASLAWDGRPSDWSSRGFWVDCSTVGEGILTTYVEGVESPVVDWNPDVFLPPDPWALCSGTSFAAPQVVGAVARRCRELGLTPREALRQILRYGRYIPDHGRALRFLPGT
jgi:subtilisin family serine protease